jgi:uncharacterized protein
MMHPATQLGFVNDVVGMGVFATEFIPKGTIVWILDHLDQRIDESAVYALDPLRREAVLKYAYRDRQGKYVLCWDLGRFMNHSSNPNVVDLPYEFEIASRDIYPGEQLTCDYGCLNLDEPFDCLPEVGTDRTTIYPGDLLRLADHYDAIGQDAMRCFSQVVQPLEYLIDPQYSAKVRAIAAGELPLDSIRTTHYLAPLVNQSMPMLV